MNDKEYKTMDYKRNENSKELNIPTTDRLAPPPLKENNNTDNNKNNK